MISALKNVTYLDVASGKWISNAVIEIHGKKIGRIALAEKDGIAGTPDHDIIDCEGLYAIPAFIDSHVHLFEVHEGPSAGSLLRDPLEDALNRALQNMHTALDIGVTTVRDVGAVDARNNLLRDRISSGVLDCSFRVISCGHHLTVHNGHFWDREYGALHR